MKKKELINLCKSLGLMLIDSGDCVRVDAPVGFVLNGSGFHYADLYTQGWKREEVYQELYHEISNGITKCEDPECDSCVVEKATFDEILKLYRGERLA